LLSLIFNTLSAALFEEIAFRGLILYALLRSWAYLRFGTLMAILVSSIFFGLVHIVKQKEENTDRWVILQGAWAISMGVLFGSFAVMSGSIWPAVFLHGTWIVMLKINLLANPNKEQKLSSLISPELLVIPLALYGFILL
jgi:membrane protease YdiL (CAAX protease family)